MLRRNARLFLKLAPEASPSTCGDKHSLLTAAAHSSKSLLWHVPFQLSLGARASETRDRKFPRQTLLWAVSDHTNFSRSMFHLPVLPLTVTPELLLLEA